ncbi:hypothetical protein [Agrobacterium sp. T29]|uniref:hypothetical protein n=1 Tax=Agrobacterium sp. T29 TaxID=2580515 RepID=UPI00143DAC27|nr:hypothetical protein [Agrobacterium sp. T29]
MFFFSIGVSSSAIIGRQSCDILIPAARAGAGQRLAQASVPMMDKAFCTGNEQIKAFSWKLCGTIAITNIAVAFFDQPDE